MSRRSARRSRALRDEPADSSAVCKSPSRIPVQRCRTGSRIAEVYGRPCPENSPATNQAALDWPHRQAPRLELAPEPQQHPTTLQSPPPRISAPRERHSSRHLTQERALKCPHYAGGHTFEETRAHSAFLRMKTPWREPTDCEKLLNRIDFCSRISVFRQEKRAFDSKSVSVIARARPFQSNAFAGPPLPSEG